MKLLMLKGLPASGKSTYALELVKEGNWTRVNKDELRKMLHGGKWSHKNEDEVAMARNAMILGALSRGNNVVVDDTNFHPKHEADFRKMCELSSGSHSFQFEVKEFDTDVEECIKRDLHRGDRAVGEQVIRKMWRQYVSPVEARHPSGSVEQAVIFDIDGTLASMGDRGPFEWSKVGVDTVVVPVRQLLWVLSRSGYKVILFSGRDSVCRNETEKWLEENEIPHNGLHMRPEGDSRKDVLVKEELYESLKDTYDFRYVVDDRPQVCRMWHTKGLTLLKVGDPDIEF